ncbi:MAG: agmatine deiminase family protein [Planctomycetes bacterium]|nr:agmatine deiminase family protein [Planctomycetota bacterium]
MRTPLAFVASAAALVAQQQYPEGADIPRALTAVEAAWLVNHPLDAGDAVTPPPTGPVHCAAEYEPMEGLCLAWEGTAGQLGVVQQIALHATTTGAAKVFVYCDSAAEATTATNTLAAAGCNMARVQTLVATTDSIWIRDYGPRYVFEGDCRAIVDHTYNRPRPNDDVMPLHFGALKGHRVYGIPLVHGGGNFHLDALDHGEATLLIANENPTLTQTQIRQHWLDYQNLDVTLRTPFPTTVDSTQHIDMWMQVYGDRQAMVSDWPNNAGSTQDVVCDSTAAALQAAGWTVNRVPARSVSSVHYTYCNMVLCNGVALVPSYTNTTVSPHNAPALAAWQAALPGKTVVPVNCQALVTSAGVMHCIVMHVPAPRGGAIPTAYLKTPNGGGLPLQPGATATVEWLADDDIGVTGVDLWLSVNGGASFVYPIAQNLPHTGSYTWTVPNLYAPQAKLRVVARDAQGNTGSDGSDASFAIAGTAFQAQSIPYGVGKPGQAGVPVLAAAPPVLGSTFALTLGNALPNAPALLLIGDAPSATPFDGGTMLVAAFTGGPIPTDPTGYFSAVIPLPDEPALRGFSFYVQAWVPNDPGASGAGWAASQGLQLLFGH